jgi:hypothetical protein
MVDKIIDCVSHQLFYRTLGAMVVLVVTTAWVIQSYQFQNQMRIIDKHTRLIEQFEVRFASDIEQHDMRIGNNADNIRAITRSLIQPQENE